MSTEGSDDGPREREGSSALESLLAQLRRKSHQDATAAAPLQPQDILSHYPPFHQAASEQAYLQQGTESLNAAASSTSHLSSTATAYPPAAPTPPGSGGFRGPQLPLSLLGAVGSSHPAADRTTSSQLLNLLKFSGQPSASSASSAPSTVSQLLEQQTASQQSEADAKYTSKLSQHSIIHAPAPAPAPDPKGLLAALMQGAASKDENSKEENSKPEASTPPSVSWASTSQSTETQKYLLNLLNRHKPAQVEEERPSADLPESTNSLVHPLGVIDQSGQQPSAAPFEHPANQASETMGATSFSTATFDFEIPIPSSKLGNGTAAPKTAFGHPHYRPHDGLTGSSSPLDRSVKNGTTPTTSITGSPAGPPGLAPLSIPIRGQSASRASVVSKASEAKPGHRGSATQTPVNKSDATLPFDTPLPGSSSENHVFEDKEASSDTDAKGHIKPEKALLADGKADADVDALKHANSDEELHVGSQSTNQTGFSDPDKDSSDNTREEGSLPGNARLSADSGPDPAQEAAVADSWENADADPGEALASDDQPPAVRVYNFPMKPWISIDVQDDDKYERPEFRDESILDIARLKKDFDQMDRNLVAASDNYMVYGMSKAGGLRVIRQDDGRDAKLFTDTKDRIFNVSLSCSNGEAGTVPKDSIIGTGVSGTVYWVQIRDGDRDHLEYAHPELHGFALPPIMAHEGDTPGGVLKTRARSSTSHPEFFAVGRGKAINVVWPNFIMKNDLFKPGHDRVVDAEKLSKLCSLKINTGKAGKDFTFSQDDSVIVSLDKSGRVKFWDVRDLTAADENSNPRYPLPLHTSLEVKEPLMVLTTTPEGEKAWPTSVLLLDKLRPYQKRCALRYMIVGMKQNHTLQLWDLALGKPVQEFNLPHSKESDAVCSVVYHPPTGMIIVGHPTRNSIYFLHLSAPKYAMKSLSQVDYIQRLTAEDSSIPQPESTAVISGLREYSFGNKGALRSLDILPNPNSVALSDAKDPTLFELYAMHSKGVSCVFIRQDELGWTKDNKVINPVDAVSAGKVKIGKLKSPQQPAAPAEAHGAVRTPPVQNAPRAIALRQAADEVRQSSAESPVLLGTPRRTVDAVADASRTKTLEIKDEDSATPYAGSGRGVERPEKKPRKKMKMSSTSTAAAVPPQTDTEPNVINGAGGSGNKTPHAQTVKTPELLVSAKAKAPQEPASGLDALDTRIDAMETHVCERVSGSVAVAFNDLKKGIDQQFRSRDADFEHKQRKLLDLVSNVLNSNTQMVLGKIVREEFDNTIVPMVRDDVARSITEKLSGELNAQISDTLQRELHKSLPTHLSSILQSQTVSKAISNNVSQAMVFRMVEEIQSMITKGVVPALSAISAQTVQTAVEDIHEKVSDLMVRLEQIESSRSEKINSMTLALTQLSETVSTMAATQARYESQIEQLQGQLSQVHRQPALPHPSRIDPPPQDAPSHRSEGIARWQQQQQQSTNIHPVAAAGSPSQHSSSSQQQQRALIAPQLHEDREQGELDNIAATMVDFLQNGRYDDAMMRWLQSNGREEELFQRVLVHHSPDIVNNLQPLILLSVGTTVGRYLDGPLLNQKLAWVEMVILNLYQVAGHLDEQTRQITPTVLLRIRERLEQTLMHISNISEAQPSIKTMNQLISIINRIVEVITQRGPAFKN